MLPLTFRILVRTPHLQAVSTFLFQDEAQSPLWPGMRALASWPCHPRRPDLVPPALPAVQALVRALSCAGSLLFKPCGAPLLCVPPPCRGGASGQLRPRYRFFFPCRSEVREGGGASDVLWLTVPVTSPVPRAFDWWSAHVSFMRPRPAVFAA